MSAVIDRLASLLMLAGDNSLTIVSTITNPDTNEHSNEAIGQGQPAKAAVAKNYRGFVAGVFSGVTKLSVGHPFDTIKVRLQTADYGRFRGPLDCLMQTIKKEGVSGLYKGATPPLLGWMAMDSLMLGSLTIYRRLLLEKVWTNPSFVDEETINRNTLPSVGHGIAGIAAGSTVSFIAAPVEHVKARLQIQYAARKTDRLYSGPIDCASKILRHHGLPGLWHGLGATLIFRSFFFFWWGSYDLFSKYFQKHTSMSTPSINFWAGGLSAQVFWLTTYPTDVVKQRIMTDPLGGGLNDGMRRFPRWRDAVRTIYQEGGYRAFWRGFVPCFLRAFPANAAALVAFEGVMRTLPE